MANLRKIVCLICLFLGVTLFQGCTPLGAVGMLASTVTKTLQSEPGRTQSGQANSRLPNNSEIAQANMQLAVAYLQRRDYEQAINKIERSLKADPNYADAYNVKALIYQQIGEVEEADKLFKKSLSLNSNNGSTLNNYGLFLCQQARYEEADDTFYKAASNPLYATPELALTNAGTCANKQGNSIEAQKYFMQALDLNPNIAAALLQMAEISYDQQSYKQAQSYFDRYAAISKHTSKSLWLGVRIGKAVRDRDAEASYALLLRNNFPDTKEAELLRDSQRYN